MPTDLDDKPKLTGSHDDVELSPAEVDQSGQPLSEAEDSPDHDYYKPSGAERAESQSLGTHAAAPGGRLARVTGKIKASAKRHKKGYLFGGTILGIGAVFGITAMFSFLAVFKLNTFQKSTEDVRMSRMQESLSIRSHRFMQTFIMASIAGDAQGNPGQNRYFLAKGWYGTGNPITQWYRDMKTTNFFNELQDKYGFQVANEAGGGGRLVAIRTAGMNVDLQNELTQNGGLDPATLFNDNVDPNDPLVKTRVADFERRVDRTIGSTNKDARRFVNKMSRDTTRWWEIFERRHKRKWAKERLGITKWKFFENTREKARKRVYAKWSSIIAERSNTARVIGCLINPAALCTSSSLNNDQNKVEVDTATAADNQRAEGDSDNPTNDTPPDDPNKAQGSKVAKKVFSDEALARIIATRAIVSTATSVTGWLDLISQIDGTIRKGTLRKIVAAAKIAQYATAYMTFDTMVDQIKAGEVSGEEVNATMQMLNDAELSDSYQNTVALEREGLGDNTASLLPLNVFAAGPDNISPESKAKWDPVTPDMKINTNNNATAIESIYEETVGQVLRPIAFAWDNSGPLKKLAVGISNAIGSVASFLGLDDAIYAAGDFLAKNLVGQSLDQVLGDVGGELLTQLGGSPICGSRNTGGRKMNCIQGGAAASQEQILEANGGHTLTTAQANAIERSYRDNQIDEFKNLPIIQRIASTDYPQSLASRMAMTLPTSTVEAMGNTSTMMANVMPSRIFGKISSSIAAIWSKPAYALTPANRNLFELTPKGLTLAELEQEPFGGKSNQECQQEQSNFKQALQKSDEEAANASSICMYDAMVANTLLSFNTDVDDGGLGDTSNFSNTPGNASGAVGDIGESSDGIACPAGTNDVGVVESRYKGTYRKSNPFMIRLCQIPDIPGVGNNAAGTNISGGAVLNSRVAGAWQALAQAAKAEGISLAASSSFRLADSCGGTGNGDKCAKPGSSPHQMGIAIDFNSMSLFISGAQCSNRARLPNSPQWAWMYKNAETWGIKQYAAEAWHWDFLPAGNRCGSSQ